MLVGFCVYGGGGIHEYELEVLADDVSSFFTLVIKYDCFYLITQIYNFYYIYVAPIATPLIMMEPFFKMILTFIVRVNFL